MHTIDTHEFIEAVLRAKNEKEKMEIIAKTIDESQKSSIKNLATKNDLNLLKIDLYTKLLPLIIAGVGILMALFKFIS